MTEIIFQYPGVGKLMQNAISSSDYNMIMATVSISIIRSQRQRWSPT